MRFIIVMGAAICMGLLVISAFVHERNSIMCENTLLDAIKVAADCQRAAGHQYE